MDLILPGGPTVPITTWLPTLLAVLVVGWVLVADRGRRRQGQDAASRVRDLQRTVERQRTALQLTERRHEAERGLEPLRFESAAHTLAATTAVVRDLSRARDPDAFLAALARHVERLLSPAQWMILTAAADEPGAFDMAASGTELGGVVWPEGRRLAPGAGRIGLLAARGPYLDAELFDDAPEPLRNRALDSEPDAFRIDAAVQVVVGEEVRAVVTVGGCDPALPAPRAVLEFLAEVAAGALEHVDAERRRREAERRDEITGLWNKPYFSAQASEVCYRNRVRGVWTTVVLVGVDAFRAFVAAEGHVAGDRLLRSVAGRVRAELGQGSLACRWANDEFLVCVPETDPVEVRDAAERLIAAVREEAWPGAGPDATVRVSAGLAATRDETVSFDDAVEEATQSLTAARWGGGDQLVAGAGFDARVDDTDPGPLTTSRAPARDARP